MCITRSRLLLLLLLFVFFFVSFFFVFAVFCLILLLYFYFVAIGCRNTHKLIATAATKLRCMLQPFIVLLYILFVFFLFLAMKFFPMHVFYVLLIHSFFRSILISFFAVPFHFVRFLFRSSCSWWTNWFLIRFFPATIFHYFLFFPFYYFFACNAILCPLRDWFMWEKSRYSSSSSSSFLRWQFIYWIEQRGNFVGCSWYFRSFNLPWNTVASKSSIAHIRQIHTNS